MTDLSADDLIARACAGDEVAFAALYRDLQPRLHRYALALVGQDADDVTAEAWLHIARDLAKFSGDLDAFRGWAARIVRNRAMDLLRSRARRPVSSTPVDELLDIAAEDDTAAAAAEIVTTAAAIELIASLPRDQAEAVLLRAVVGLDAAAAGKILGKSAAAVRVCAHRGLRTLRRSVPSSAETNSDRPALGN